MNHRYSLLFVLVDATQWRESALALANGDHVGAPTGMGVSGDMACMLVQAGDLNRIDAKVEEWVLSAARRIVELTERYSHLTPRERQALPLITGGMLNKQAASILGISEATLQIHRGRIMQKMGARSFADLVRIADTLRISVDGEGSRGSWRARQEATSLRRHASKDAA